MNCSDHFLAETNYIEYLSKICVNIAAFGWIWRTIFSNQPRTLDFFVINEHLFMYNENINEFKDVAIFHFIVYFYPLKSSGINWQK